MAVPKNFGGKSQRFRQSYSNKVYRKFEKEVRPSTPEDQRISSYSTKSSHIQYDIQYSI